ncbi:MULTISPECIES: hypothetical protein [Streptomyces]|uniref:hypothetical protein n=1 Tax=Streptomyces TaxID=1883 RepID=UPI00087E19FB|nr:MULTISPECIES: hypothetical protein [unclassified Streptomyces]PBC72271.1 hypothetical protein BX261_7355 [Streptomyces sp. 2321.6]SDR61894.1 hypothetical protein SAMN05216511_7214 [Streptomyces sp. KS_16]SEE48710.1 hypothetical protein SAMN05428940_7263 [Streptomyces sp. 2133.1]SNC77776.1 hypothetical protein SAMN06272741_7192 [Streptomyces sp. 2114.4]
MSSKAERKQARAEHRAAKQALHNNQAAEKKAGISHETDTYRELNARVNETEKSVPWYRR